MNQPLLETRDLNKRFHALAAVNAVSLAVARGEVHAIIGPNGAGKTTLINLLSGDLPPSAGRVLFKGRDIAGHGADRISRLGISRSYQRTNIFPSLTCIENCWLAAQSRLKSSMRFFLPAGRRHDVRLRAEGALDVCGLAARAGIVASALSHGEQRQLELGMVLATEPELLLLDEPLAGMGTEEAAGIVELLRRLARSHTIVLIEHDMDAVFAIANRITVMVNGEVLATGSPDEIRQNRAVQAAYLGTDEGPD
jgi:branched-chain amino acid transport system ATP-binding protein